MDWPTRVTLIGAGLALVRQLFFMGYAAWLHIRKEQDPEQKTVLLIDALSWPRRPASGSHRERPQPANRPKQQLPPAA
jgi:hypothetical protein